MVRYFLLGALLVGCGFGDDRHNAGGVDGGVDGKIDAPPLEMGHLLITEVKSTGPVPTGAGEFIEIWNPTNRAIDLSRYYLADYGDYWKLPAGVPQVTSDDFLVRFPNGAMIQSDQVITIATNASDYAAQYPSAGAATYAIDATTGSQAMGQRFIGSGVPQITNSGEIIVLFYWDGLSDLIKDVDIVLAGRSADTSAGNNLTTKQPVDGPDADTTATPYKVDDGSLGGGMTSAASNSTSYKRRNLEAGAETQAGTGNGITGDDETSESLKSTWDGDTAQPLSAPTPGAVPAI